MKGRNWVGTAFTIALIVLTLSLLTLMGEIVKVLVVSVLLAYIIDPVAVFMESKGMSRTSATVIIFSSFLMVVAIFIFLFYPTLFSEIDAIQRGLDSGETQRMVTRIEAALEDNFGFLGVKDLDLMSKMHNAMVSTGTWIFDHLLDVVSLITHLVIVPIFVFFLLKDGRQIMKQLVRIIPNRYFEFSLSLLHKMDVQLGNYFRGQFLDALIFGMLSTFALWVLGVKYFLVIGIFAGLANLIPFLGPIAGAAPAILVSVLDTGDLKMALYVIGAFALMKLIDDAVVQPIVVAKSVDMHPLLVLLAVIIGGKFFGILGMLLSVPVTGFFKVVLKEGIASARKYRLT